MIELNEIKSYLKESVEIMELISTNMKKIMEDSTVLYTKDMAEKYYEKYMPFEIGEWNYQEAENIENTAFKNIGEKISIFDDRYLKLIFNEKLAECLYYFPDNHSKQIEKSFKDQSDIIYNNYTIPELELFENNILATVMEQKWTKNYAMIRDFVTHMKYYVIEQKAYNCKTHERENFIKVFPDFLKNEQFNKIWNNILKVIDEIEPYAERVESVKNMFGSHISNEIKLEDFHNACSYKKSYK